MIFHINDIAELLSLLVAIFYYRYLRGTFMKWVLPFLAFIFFGERYATYQWYVLKVPTININYLIACIESIFYGYVFYSLSRRVLIKKAILYFVLISEIGYIISFIFFRKNYAYFFGNIIASGFFIAVIALAYLYMKFVEEEDDEVLLVSEPGFWIAFGVSLFYSGVSISFSLYEYMKRNVLVLFGEKLINLIPQILSVILYLSISIAIILCKQKKKILS